MYWGTVTAPTIQLIITAVAGTAFPVNVQDTVPATATNLAGVAGVKVIVPVVWAKIGNTRRERRARNFIGRNSKSG